jgi:hypothetical protein
MIAVTTIHGRTSYALGPRPEQRPARPGLPGLCREGYCHPDGEITDKTTDPFLGRLAPQGDAGQAGGDRVCARRADRDREGDRGVPTPSLTSMTWTSAPRFTSSRRHTSSTLSAETRRSRTILSWTTFALMRRLNVKRARLIRCPPKACTRYAAVNDGRLIQVKSLQGGHLCKRCALRPTSSPDGLPFGGCNVIAGISIPPLRDQAAA